MEHKNRDSPSFSELIFSALNSLAPPNAILKCLEYVRYMRKFQNLTIESNFA